MVDDLAVSRPSSVSHTAAGSGVSWWSAAIAVIRRDKVDVDGGSPTRRRTGPVVLAEHRVRAHQLEVDVPVPDRDARGWPTVAGCADVRDEPRGWQAVDEVARMQSCRGCASRRGSALQDLLALRRSIHEP